MSEDRLAVGFVLTTMAVLIVAQVKAQKASGSDPLNLLILLLVANVLPLSLLMDGPGRWSQLLGPEDQKDGQPVNSR
jgi:hypothetical protein